ncbi:hypothetical protein DPMN_165788 [Dreissena polymorpha]|uniref:Uncharacterized protein n=1 Tax=Dreissena polymorpha TaxID=45954 RepID=A0A9D4F0C2_DREPO|nr:hypothetical protein DPMN_165788 [Dreissena polymorpha]
MLLGYNGRGWYMSDSFASLYLGALQSVSGGERLWTGRSRGRCRPWVDVSELVIWLRSQSRG